MEQKTQRARRKSKRKEGKLMTKIKSFYLNKNKVYKSRELITNWTLSFSLTGLVTFLILTVVYGNFLTKEEFYKQPWSMEPLLNQQN